MKFNIFYPFFGFLIICFFIYLRFKSFFRQPIYITIPFHLKNILILLILFFIFSIILYFSIRLFIGKSMTFQNKIILNFFEKLENILMFLRSFHEYLSKFFEFYGTICNFFNNLFQYYGICQYPFIFILLFSVFPVFFFLFILLIEILVYMRLQYTFYFLPLIILPLIGKVLLFIILDFIHHNKNSLKTQIDFQELHLSSIDSNINLSIDKEINDEIFFNYLKKKNLIILKVVETNKKSMSLSVKELFYLYMLFDTFEQNISNLYSIFIKYDKLVSIFKYFIFICLILFLFYLNYMFIK